MWEKNSWLDLSNLKPQTEDFETREVSLIVPVALFILKKSLNKTSFLALVRSCAFLCWSIRWFSWIYFVEQSPPQYRHRMSWVIYHCLHKNCAQHIHHSQVACVQQRGLQDLWHQACCLWRQCYVHSFLSFLGNLMFFCRVYCFTNFRSKSKSQNTQKVMTNKNFEKKACEFFLLFFFFSLLISFSYCSQVDTSWFPLRQKKKPSSLWSSPVNIQRA